jgi:ATP phosphoribosyltransferase regulatory subunit
MDALLHTPDGVRDIYGRECAARNVIEENILKQFRLYGYDRIETPNYEFFDVFNRTGGTISSREMFKFFDRDNNTLVLRPDITPAIARCVSKYFRNEDMPIRLCYLGDIFQNHKNYKGTLSESTQSGVELIGDDTVDADVEMIVLAIDCLLSAGLKEFQVEIGEVDFYRGLVEEAGLSPDEDEALRILIENRNSFGVEEFVEANITDEAAREGFLKLTELFGSIDVMRSAKTLTGSAKALAAIDRLEKISEIIESYGFSEYVSYDLGMLSQQQYYTGMIFKAFSYGTGDYIVTGGRYDDLLRRFGPDLPAVGFGISIDRLYASLMGQRIEIPVAPVDCLVVYRKHCTAKAVAEIRALRSAGKRVTARLMDTSAGKAYYEQYAVRHGIQNVKFFDE